MTKSTFGFSVFVTIFCLTVPLFLVKIRKVPLYFMVATVIHGSFLCLLPHFIMMFRHGFTRHLLALLYVALVLCPC